MPGLARAKDCHSKEAHTKGNNKILYGNKLFIIADLRFEVRAQRVNLRKIASAAKQQQMDTKSQEIELSSMKSATAQLMPDGSIKSPVQIKKVLGRLAYRGSSSSFQLLPLGIHNKISGVQQQYYSHKTVP